MKQTRREFIITASALACAAALPHGGHGAGSEPLPYDDPRCLVGDPYLATTHERGFGTRDFEPMRENALRFRSTAKERDRLALGLEI
ncbi:MAG TPA: hypothetical protein VIL97_02925 [Thermoanaerobaculia bacterium]